MWDGYIEADTREKLRIVRHDGIFGGKAACGFLVMLSNYCLFPNEPDFEDLLKWFVEFENLSGLNTCEDLASLEKAWYQSDWGDYLSDEREFAVKRKGFEISQFDFELVQKNVQESWTPILDVKKAVELLIAAFKHSQPQSTDWYNATDTLPEFEGILTGLQLLEKRSAKLVRIQFVM
jgi:hypothetical protein